MIDNQKVRLGVIGCGFIAQSAHFPAIQKAEGIRLSAVCDLSEKLVNAVRTVYGVSRGYTRYQDLLRDSQVDAVLITVPDPLHFQVASDCLKARKPILLEKPLTVTVEEARLLVKEVAESSGKLQVGFMKRFDPGLQFAREFVVGRQEKILTFSGWYCDSAMRPQMQKSWFAPLLPGTPLSARPVLKEDLLEYKLRTHGSHLIDLARYMCGDVRAVTAQHREQNGVFSWQILAEFESGCVGTLELTLASRMDWLEGFRLHADFGSIQAAVSWPFYRQPAHVRIYDEKEQVYRSPTGPDSDPYERQIEAFARAVLDHLPLSPDINDGLACQRILSAVHQSCEQKTRLEISQI